MTRKHPRRATRRGAAVVEFAICLPLLLFLMFATLEVCDAILLEESLQVAAYEGARQVLRSDASETTIKAAAQAVIDSRLITGSTIEIVPANFLAAADGAFIEVKVSAPAAGHVLGLARLFEGDRVSSSSFVMKEY